MIGWRFNEPSPLRDMLEQMLEEQRRFQRASRGEPMPINVHDDDGNIVVEASLPGVRPDEIEINCSENLLTIRAQSTVAERDYIHQELRPVNYLRQVMLPADCRFDGAQADSENGVLTIRIPKLQPKPPEKVRIQVTRRGGQVESPIEAGPGSYTEVETPSSGGSSPSGRAPRASGPRAGGGRSGGGATRKRQE